MSDLKDHHLDWIHEFTGINPRGVSTPNAAPALAAEPTAGSDQQSQKFRTDFDPIVVTIDGHLAFTAEHAEQPLHAEKVKTRAALMTDYGSALKQIDPADETKAKPAIDKVLAQASATQNDTAIFRQTVEAAFNDWQSRASAFTDAVKQVAEMEDWAHPQAAALADQATAIRDLAQSRKYAEASKAHDAFSAAVKPPYADYVTQKAAQEKYDPARKALEPRLAAAQSSTFHSLDQTAAAFSPALSEMDAAATAKQYVQALQLEQAFEPKLADFEAKLKQLQDDKKVYEDALAAIEDKVDQQSQRPPPFHQLEKLQDDLEAARKQMQDATTAEDFKTALQHCQELGGKADLVKQLRDEMEAKKKAYEAVAEPLAERVTAAAAQSSFKTLQAQQSDLATRNGEMHKTADDQDYDTATQHAHDLATALDTYEKSATDLQQKKQLFDDAVKALQPQLDAAKQPSHKPLATLQGELLKSEEQMKQTADTEDFATALSQAQALSAQVDTYAKAVTELEQAKKEFDEKLKAVVARIDQAAQSKFPQLEAQNGEIAAARQAVEALAADEKYTDALKAVDDLTSKVEAYEKTLHDIEQHKKDFEEARQAMQKRLDAIGKPPHPKLKTNEDDIGATLKSVDEAAGKQDYETAAKLVLELGAKLDAYDTGLANIGVNKDAYDNAWKQVKPQLDLITKDGKPMDEKVAQLKATVETSVAAEEYEAALNQTREMEQALQALTIQMEGGSISGTEKPEEETQKVMASIAGAHTRAAAYLTGHELQITQAVTAFKGAAQKQIDAISGDAPGWWQVADFLVSSVGGAISKLYPPAGYVVTAATYLSTLGKAVRQDRAKTAKESLTGGVEAFATGAAAAAHSAFAAEAQAFSKRLSDLANSDKKMWDALAIGGDRQLEDAVKALGITDPAASRPFDPVMKTLMSQFAVTLAKVKFEMDKTNLERMQAEELPSQDSYKELHKQMDDAKKDGEAQAEELGRTHRIGQ